MIQFIVHSENDQSTIAFKKNYIVLGNTPEADWTLPEEKIQGTHLTISEERGEFYVLNSANDPFTTLNGKSFWKRPLKQGDKIQVGRTELEVAECSPVTTSDPLDAPPPFPPLEDLIDHTIKKRTQQYRKAGRAPRGPSGKPPSSIEEIPSGNRQATTETVVGVPLANSQTGKFLPGSKEDIPKVEEDIDVDFLMREVETWETQAKQMSPLPQPHEPLVNPPPERTSFKDFYLSEFDDESEIWQQDHTKSLDHSAAITEGRSWKTLLTWGAIIILFTTLITGIIYLKVTDKSDVEAIRATRLLSDVAMSLTQAHLKQSHPKNQNLSDPEFLKNNLTSILGLQFTPYLNVDAQGQCTDCSYLMRIYTNSELSQFLLIAQPAPSLLQWLLPRYSIVLDSRTMQLRKIVDLRTLNRLLTNSSPLDGVNGDEIAQQVDTGELIALQTLNSRRRNEGFSPPKSLSLIRPGAESYVYNAPRYYPLGDAILGRAIDLYEKQGVADDVILLQQQVSLISRLSDIVLYTSKGLQSAVTAQKALTTFVPAEKLLIGYLTFSSKDGMMGGHLLLTESGESSRYIDPIAAAEQSGIEVDQHEDLMHPLYLKLLSLRQERYNKLFPLAQELIGQVEHYTHKPIPDFYLLFSLNLNHFYSMDQEVEQWIKGEIVHVQGEYSSLPLSEFMRFSKIAGIEDLTIAALHIEENPEKTDQALEEVTHEIHTASSWAELQSAVVRANKLLCLTQDCNAQVLTPEQEEVKSLTLQTIRRLLLSPDSDLNSTFFDPQNRQLFVEILDNAWMTEEGQRIFLLQEFDVASQK